MDIWSPEELAALRKQVTGSRLSIAALTALNRESTRTVYDVLKRHPEISTIMFCGQRLVDPVEFAEKRARRVEGPELEPLPPPRQPGRPKKVRS